MTGRRTLSMRASVAVLFLVAVSVAGCSSGADSEPSGERQSQPSTTSPRSSTKDSTKPSTTLQWHDCDGGECATLRVPLDDAHPDRRQIELALFRVAAADPSRRIGSLLLNPGGPGGSGVEFARWFVAELPESLRDRFDIVGWDPRGTGRSSPVDCGRNLDYLFAVDTAPDDATEQAALEAAGKRFADACGERSGDLLAHISSVDTARDMDRIRAAVGDERLTYLGYSYGTYLGSLYEDLFPGNVRALVLDGAVDPTLSAQDASVQQAVAFEHSLDMFLDWCADHDDCAINDGPRRVFEAVRERSETRPLQRRFMGEMRVLGPSQLDIAVASELYGGEPAYAELAAALSDARGGDPRALLSRFDSYVGRHPGGSYSHEWAAFLGIGCLDGPTLTLPETRALEAKAAQASPHFGAATVGLGVPCSVWPVPPNPRTPAPTTATPTTTRPDHTCFGRPRRGGGHDR